MELACCFLIVISLVLHGNLLLPGSGFFLVACQSTNITFPTFNGVNQFITLGDVTTQSSSMILNSQFFSNNAWHSCGRFLYPEMVRMHDPSTGQVASFSTSFTFEITNTTINATGTSWQNSDGFAFTLTPDNSTNHYTLNNGEILCDDHAITTRLLAVEVDTWRHAEDFDPSNAHIAIDINNTKHQNLSYVYDVCQPPAVDCSFFATNAGPFTVWVDYDGPTQMLDVRFAPRSSASSKPALANITLKNLDLRTVLNEFIYVGFSGSFGLYPEVHRILSWNFSSSMSSAPPPEPFSPPPSPQPLSPPPYPQAANRSNNHVGLISGIVAGACGAAIILILGIFLSFCYYRRRQNKNQGSNKSTTLKQLHLIGPQIFSYRKLSKATKDFSQSELLGSGGFGAVYKGTLQPSGALVAVKRCTSPDKPHAEQGFVAEATSISQIRHRNLVHLQGWCQEKGQLLLVYDYMPNGSLDQWLHFNSSNNPRVLVQESDKILTWEFRYNILAGVASALTYLHEEWQQCVLHRDIKSSNVMLDGEFSAHLGDFGLARLIDHHKAEKTTAMAGTLGYMAPEMAYTGRASKETDVYSLGVLILEVVCGRRPLDLRALNPEEIVLVDCVWRAHEAGDLLSVADPRLGTYDRIASLSAQVVSNIAAWEEEENFGRSILSYSKPNSVKDVLEVGLLCCQLNPRKRPSMRLVNQVFQSTTDGAAALLPPLPATKPPMPYAYSEAEITSSGITSSSSTRSSVLTPKVVLVSDER